MNRMKENIVNASRDSFSYNCEATNNTESIGKDIIDGQGEEMSEFKDV